MKIDVFIIGDHVLIRTAVAGLLKRQHDIRVAGDSDLTSDVVNQVEQSGATVVLFLANDEAKAIGEEARRLYDGLAGVPVIVVLHGGPDTGRAVEALRMGARGLLDKNADGERLAEAIREAQLGEITIMPRFATHLVEGYAALASSKRGPFRDGLSQREIDVLGLLARGQTNQQIAEQLSLSVHTVRAHLRSVMQKLGARNRVQAAAYAVNHGLDGAAPGADIISGAPRVVR